MNTHNKICSQKWNEPSYLLNPHDLVTCINYTVISCLFYSRVLDIKCFFNYIYMYALLVCVQYEWLHQAGRSHHQCLIKTLFFDVCIYSLPCIIICVFLNHCCLLFLTGFCVLCSFILLYSPNFITSLPLLVIVTMAMHLDSASARYKADIMSKTIQARIEANRTSHSIIGKVGLGIYIRDPNRKNSLFMGNLTWVSIHHRVSLRVYFSSIMCVL